MNTLRAFAATPLPEELCELIERLEPRVTMVRDQSLLPPQLHPADHSGDSSFRRDPESQRRYRQLVDSAEALYGLPDQSPLELARTVRANPGLRWVHATPAGGGAQVKAAALDAADLERVLFTKSAGLHAEPLAEFAVFGVMAGAKTLPRLVSLTAAHEWGERWVMRQIGESTVVVVGLGGIGRATVGKLAALGARVIGVHRHAVDLPGLDHIVPVERLAEALAEADAVVMTLPATDSTFHLLGREALAHLKPGATVVNVGRGSTIDEDALIDALENGTVGFAALDVFEQEPLTPASRIWSAPNLMVSPHTAAIRTSEERLMAELFAANATRLLDGLPLVNRIDTVEFY